MVMEYYPIKYSDAYGTENSTIHNDGTTLRINLRGIQFSGMDFDSLEPSEVATAEQLRYFTLYRGELCSCQLTCDMSVSIHDNGQDLLGILTIELLLGDPAPNGGLDRVELIIVLIYNGQQFASSGKSGWFEDELLDIQKQLPDNVYMRACINCLFSDYSPYGHGLFGSMMCFRNLKQAYLQVTDKDSFWDVHDRYDRLVQETFLCTDFQRRIPGTGYRG